MPRSLEDIQTDIGYAPGDEGMVMRTWHKSYIREWLNAQGIDSSRTDAMRESTLYKAYTKPSYLRAMLTRGDYAPGAQRTPTPAPRIYHHDHDTGALSPTPAPEGYAGSPYQQIISPAPVAPDAGAAAQLASLIQSIARGSVNEQRVIDLIREHAPRPAVTTIEIVRPDAPEPVDLGLQHRMFPQLLKAAIARMPAGDRLNIWISGPAGSGKTTAAANVAKALDLPFYFNGAIDNEYKLLGFTDAQGRVVSRPFRQAYENGGVYLFDEVDASLPSALLAFNAATANGHADFPDGIIQRHKDCIILAAGNTFGHGANADYVGRMKQDAAFLDRFVTLPWTVDEDLEAAVCTNNDWVRRVQSVRAKVTTQGLKVIVSPRATFYGAALLAAGMSWAETEQMALRKGMSNDQWAQVSA